MKRREAVDLLETSFLLGGHDPGEREGAISAASLAERYFGVLAVTDPDEARAGPSDSG